MAKEITPEDINAPVVTVDTTANESVDSGNPSDTPAEAQVAEVAPIAEPAPEMKPVGPSGQAPEALTANNGPTPPGRLIIQKTIKELEDELDGGVFGNIEEFVKSHWEAQDASVQRMADVLRMDVLEVWEIVKSFGVKLSQGM